jgi:hypothetical protein
MKNLRPIYVLNTPERRKQESDLPRSLYTWYRNAA